MRLLLPDEDSELRHSDRWALLPELCCQAAGGDPGLTTEISAAWFLLYLAGHLVDGVEDGDEVDKIAALGGPASAINIANGYFLSAAMMLNDLLKADPTKSQAYDISLDFYNTIMIMASGQNDDINLPLITLNKWWQIAEAKTGSFFSLACRSGARLGTADGDKIAAFSKFGFHLGLMLQVHDDLGDLQSLIGEETSEIPKGFMRSLAVAYALDVLPETEYFQLEQLLAGNPSNRENVNQIIDLLDQCGAGFYLLAEMERHYTSGIQSLQRAEPLPPAKDELKAMIGGLRLK